MATFQAHSYRSCEFDSLFENSSRIISIFVCENDNIRWGIQGLILLLKYKALYSYFIVEMEFFLDRISIGFQKYSTKAQAFSNFITRNLIAFIIERQKVCADIA